MVDILLDIESYVFVYQESIAELYDKDIDALLENDSAEWFVVGNDGRVTLKL